MIDFTKIPNIHYWTQRVLPLVFDESLSYVEKVNKLEEEINKLIEDYNTFGQAVTNEINTFEGETTNQINAFVTQITNDINSFKQNITNNINSFETDIRNIVEEFETSVTNSINAMQEVINGIPDIIEEKVNTLTMPYLQENVPSLVQQVISEKALTSLSEVDTKDLNTLTSGIMYSFINSDTILNKPTKLESGSFCIVYTFKPKSGNGSLSQRLVVCSGYTLGKSYYRKSELGTFPTTDTWVEETDKYTSVTPASVTDFDSLQGNTIYCTYLNTETFTNYPNDIPNNSYINVMTSFKEPTKTLRIQFVYILYTPNTSNIVGSFRYRYELQPNLWSIWSSSPLNYQYKEILANTQLNDLTKTGIYTISGESQVTIGGLPSTILQYGSFYIRVTANRIATNSDEIVQEVINAGSGACSYIREKQGAQWSNWSKTRRLVYTTNTLASITDGSWGYDFNTQIPITGVEGLAGGYEAELNVSASSASTQMPALVTGVVLNSVDSKIHANVLLYSPNTKLISGSYNVTLSLYDKR